MLASNASLHSYELHSAVTSVSCTRNCSCEGRGAECNDEYSKSAAGDKADNDDELKTL